MRKIDTLVIHCSATPEGKVFTADDIRRWHKAKGWADIGYHHVIRLDGTVEKGRPELVPGAHVSGHNLSTIGICYIGGVAKDGKTAKDTRTEPQKAAMRKLVDQLLERYPDAKVCGHRDFPGVAKACPSFDAGKWERETRRTDPDVNYKCHLK